MKISLFGTGLMGSAMTEALMESGHKLTVFNRTVSKTKAVRLSGAAVVSNPAEAGKLSDVWITMLTDYKVIYEVIIKGGLPFSGKTLIQMSTISPAESQKLKGMVEKEGAEYLEAPVLGSVPQIRNRTLFMLVGCARNRYDYWLPLLSEFGKDVIYVGETGKASALKLALNQLIASQTAAFAMSLGYLINKKVDTNIFMNILRKSALYAPTFDKKLTNMLKRDFQGVNFPLKHLLKDINLIRDEFLTMKINTSVIEGIKNILEEGISSDYSNEDYSALYKVVNPSE